MVNNERIKLELLNFTLTSAPERKVTFVLCVICSSIFLSKSVDIYSHILVIFHLNGYDLFMAPNLLIAFKCTFSNSRNWPICSCFKIFFKIDCVIT